MSARLELTLFLVALLDRALGWPGGLEASAEFPWSFSPAFLEPPRLTCCSLATPVPRSPRRVARTARQAARGRISRPLARAVALPGDLCQLSSALLVRKGNGHGTSKPFRRNGARGFLADSAQRLRDPDKCSGILSRLRLRRPKSIRWFPYFPFVSRKRGLAFQCTERVAPMAFSSESGCGVCHGGSCPLWASKAGQVGSRRVLKQFSLGAASLQMTSWGLPSFMFFGLATKRGSSKTTHMHLDGHCLRFFHGHLCQCLRF